MLGHQGCPLFRGKILYSRYGVTSKDKIAGKLAALNHDTHGFVIITPSSSANFKHNKFCAAAVRNKALELPAACEVTETSTHQAYHIAESI